MSSINTITTPDSVVVVPVSNNINFLESGSITITGSPGNISFSVTNGGLSWNEETSSPVALIANNGYISNSASLISFSLPSSCSQGSIIQIVGKGSGGWEVTQGVGQTIYFGIINTTTGVGGSIASTDQRDSVTLLCITADLEFQILSAVGDIFIA